MDRLDMALALIQEAKDEKARLEAFTAEYNRAAEIDLRDPDKDSWAERQKVYNKFTPTPHKSVVTVSSRKRIILLTSRSRRTIRIMRERLRSLSLLSFATTITRLSALSPDLMKFKKERIFYHGKNETQ